MRKTDRQGERPASDRDANRGIPKMNMPMILIANPMAAAERQDKKRAVE